MVQKGVSARYCSSAPKDWHYESSSKILTVCSLTNTTGILKFFRVSQTAPRMGPCAHGAGGAGGNHAPSLKRKTMHHQYPEKNSAEICKCCYMTWSWGGHGVPFGFLLHQWRVYLSSLSFWFRIAAVTSSSVISSSLLVVQFVNETREDKRTGTAKGYALIKTESLSATVHPVKDVGTLLWNGTVNCGVGFRSWGSGWTTGDRRITGDVSDRWTGTHWVGKLWVELGSELGQSRGRKRVALVVKTIFIAIGSQLASSGTIGTVLRINAHDLSSNAASVWGLANGRKDRSDRLDKGQASLRIRVIHCGLDNIICKRVA